MIYASNYRGKIPLELYLKLINEFPPRTGEDEASWLRRVKRDPTLARKMFGTLEFKTELMQAVQIRAMAQAGARRAGHQQKGPALITLKKPGDANAKDTFASAYEREFMVTVNNEMHYKYATQAYDLLMEMFDAATPANGSIFWNGINELALAKLVDEWNSELGGEIFGQLEATTAARYVNKKFEWDQGGVFQKYFTEVSDRLGHHARGHVTSVVRCGMRCDSIFTITELPRMFKGMEEQIRRKQQPTITDLTIVVIEPKHLENRQVVAYTNNEITMIPIVRPLPGRRINSRADCTIDQTLGVGALVREYWSGRNQVKESAAATRIKRDFEKLVRW